MMIVKRLLILFFVLCFRAKGGTSGGCPSKYQRFHKDHTFCVKSNNKCNIVSTGTSLADTEKILQYHNAFRNITAMGRETRAKGGSLPQAADMMQMVWDKELASIAQKWTNNCEYKHDCDECRMVQDYLVGQNLGRKTITCGKGCERKDLTEPEWESIIRMFYDEVKDYQKTWFKTRIQTEKTGHFSQVVWGSTWRVGCGYTVFKEGDKYTKFHACNYGPAGNTKNTALYKEGKPCSACPENSCCGGSCKKSGGMDFAGLCKMMDSETAPIYTREIQNLIFFCDSKPKTKDCGWKINGTKNWKEVNSLSGHFMSIELRGGQSTEMRFENEIKPTRSNFCVEVIYRKTSSRAQEKDASSASVELKTDTKTSTKKLASTISFSKLKLNFKWKKPTKVAILFSVPSGKNQHILEIKEIVSYDGQCK